MMNKYIHDHIDRLEEENAILKRALYMMCSDYYSMRYPNISRTVEDIYQGYIDEARKEAAKD